MDKSICFTHKEKSPALGGSGYKGNLVGESPLDALIRFGPQRMGIQPCVYEVQLPILAGSRNVNCTSIGMQTEKASSGEKYSIKFKLHDSNKKSLELIKKKHLEYT